MIMDPSRITLRHFQLSDADDLLSWAGDDRVTESVRWKTLISKEEALTFIKEVCIPHPWLRSICMDDRSIGIIAAFPDSSEIGRCRADISYAIALGYWGQGIATRAVKIAIPEMFKAFPKIVRLQGLAFLENKASQRVLEKAGFTKDGLLRKYFYVDGKIHDVVIYSVLSSYWV